MAAVALLAVPIALATDQHRRLVERLDAERAATRSSQIGTGARSEKIRTYNYPQSRVTDHRIKFTAHDLDQVLLGALEPFTSALQAEWNREQLEAASADG